MLQGNDFRFYLTQTSLIAPTFDVFILINVFIVCKHEMFYDATGS